MGSDVSNFVYYSQHMNIANTALLQWQHDLPFNLEMFLENLYLNEKLEIISCTNVIFVKIHSAIKCLYSLTVVTLIKDNELLPVQFGDKGE